MIPTTGDAICFQAEGIVPFPLGWAWQRQLQERLLADPTGPEALLLLEHEPCYTLGRGADPSFLGFDPDEPPAPLFRIDRGGEVTHHTPGQLVLYPVLNLQRHGADLHVYLRELEGVVIDLLAVLGLHQWQHFKYYHRLVEAARSEQMVQQVRAPGLVLARTRLTSPGITPRPCAFRGGQRSFKWRTV